MSVGSGGSDQATVRPATLRDAGRIAALSDQLGYPATREEMARRLARIGRDERHAVYVAEVAGRVVGWVHVCARELVIADALAEIEGLIVDEGCRRGGIGRLLMQQAERWARETGCRAVYLRSNAVRKSAHAFYEGVGYACCKTSLTFRKAL